MQLHQETGVEQGKEIDDTGLLGQAMAEKAGRALAHRRRERVEHRQGAQGKTGVVEIGAALAAGETAVGILSIAKETGMATEEILRQAADAVGQALVQLLEVSAFGHLAPNQFTGSRTLFR